MPISTEEFEEYFQFEYTEENLYDENEDAKAQMEQRIRRQARYNNASNETGPCTCVPVNGIKCLGNACLNGHMGLECPRNCRNGCANNLIRMKRFREYVRVGTNTERGWALFATRNIPCGTLIGEVCGVLEMGGAPPNSFCFLVGEQMVRSGEEQLWLNTEHVGNEFRWLNTSCHPNARTRQRAFKLTMHVGIETSREIQQNEEITIPYSRPEFYVGCICTCGRPNCPIRTANQQQANGNNNNILNNDDGVGEGPAAQRPRLM